MIDADADVLRSENALLREEIDSLRTALTIKEARARYRDDAKHEVASLLGLKEHAPIHEMVAAIRGVIAERDRLRRLVAGQSE